jgi:hypothetical protein
MCKYVTLERFIIVAMATISIASVFYIPKEKYRLALISFLVFQVITWAGSIILIQIGLIEYPVREFTRATRGSFVLLFVFLPMIYSWFILIYPNKAPLMMRILHYFIFTSISVWFMYFICVYTGLQKFLKYTMLFNVIALYIRLLIYFKICHVYIKWFSKKANLSTGG